MVLLVRVICPLKKRLALDRTTGSVAFFTILLDLPEMTSERLPSLNLDTVQRRETTSKVVSAVPFKPSSSVGVFIRVG